jgi:hypothetical protein
MVRGRLITGPLPTLQRNQTLVGGWGTLNVPGVETPLPGLARKLPVPAPPVGTPTSSDAEGEENSFVPPPVLMRGSQSTTQILPTTDDMPLTGRARGRGWGRAFLAGGVLGGLVVGVVSFRGEVARFVAARLHRTAAPQVVAAPPPPVEVPAPAAAPAPPPPPPPAAAAAADEPAAAAAPEPTKIFDEAVGTASQGHKTATAGAGRTAFRSTRPLAHSPAATARRKVMAARPGSGTAPAKGEDWVDPFSDGTWTKIPSSDQ